MRTNLAELALYKPRLFFTMVSFFGKMFLAGQIGQKGRQFSDRPRMMGLSQRPLIPRPQAVTSQHHYLLSISGSIVKVSSLYTLPRKCLAPSGPRLLVKLCGKFARGRQSCLIRLNRIDQDEA